DTLATMELFRVNSDFWDEMIPTLPCPTVAPVCLPPTDDYIALSHMSINVRKRESLPLQVTLVDYGHNVYLGIGNHEYVKLRELQPNELNIILLDNGLPSSILRAKAINQKYRVDDD
ncbi:23466_t:CDS:2, partial [Gigaspora rosea]